MNNPCREHTAWDTYYDTIHDTQVFIRETVGMTEEEKKKALFKAKLEGKLIDFDLVGTLRPHDSEAWCQKWLVKRTKQSFKDIQWYVILHKV